MLKLIFHIYSHLCNIVQMPLCVVFVILIVIMSYLFTEPVFCSPAYHRTRTHCGCCYEALRSVDWLMYRDTCVCVRTAPYTRNIKPFVSKKKIGKGINLPPYCPLQTRICFVSQTPHLFSRWSNQRVHYKGHVAVTQMAEWADCDLCTKSECITVSFWSQCQFQTGIFTHFSTRRPTQIMDTQK